jgi:hypothetical protein
MVLPLLGASPWQRTPPLGFRGEESCGEVLLGAASTHHSTKMTATLAIADSA